MNKIEIIKYLAKEIEMEEDKFKRYEDKRKYALKKSEETGISFWRCFTWEESIPSKSKIKEYLKTIRRITLEIDKEFKDVY